MIRGTMRAWYAFCYPSDRYPRIVTPELSRIVRAARGAPEGAVVLSCLVHRDDPPPRILPDGLDWSPWYVVRHGQLVRCDLGAPDAPGKATGTT